MSELEHQHPDFDAACPCGFGKTYGQCCGAGEACACGSGKPYKDCCGAE